MDPGGARVKKQREKSGMYSAFYFKGLALYWYFLRRNKFLRSNVILWFFDNSFILVETGYLTSYIADQASAKIIWFPVKKRRN